MYSSTYKIGVYTKLFEIKIVLNLFINILIEYSYTTSKNMSRICNYHTWQGTFKRFFMRRVLETRFESADSFTCNRQHIPIDFILEDHVNFHKLLAYIEVDT